MNLADKIIYLRKKSGWSQEELGARLGVSRQAVSKWESSQSVPELDKIIQLSEIFGVTADYLIKDGQEAPVALPERAETESAVFRVTAEQAEEYLALRGEAAPKMALAAFLCIISPIALMLLGALSEMPGSGISENAAAGIGLVILLTLVALGVSLFLGCAAKSRDFAFLESEPIETEHGVSAMAAARKKEFRHTGNRLNTAGTLLCILSVVPLFISVCFDAADYVYVCAVCLLLIIVGVSCIAFVYAGTVNSAFDKLLETGDYTREAKRISGVLDAVSICYWLAAAAVFLIVTFLPSIPLKIGQSWIIWPIAGILYAVYTTILGLILRAKSGR